MSEREHRRPPSVTDPGLLAGVVARARALFGDSFEDLMRSYRRRRGRGVVSPARLHPLFALVEAAESSIESLRSARPIVHPVEILELRRALDVFEEWQDDPAWPAIRRSLTNPTGFDHAVITLASASYLRRFRNAVGLIGPGADARPDFWIAVPPREPLMVEVKTPLRLRVRSQPLDQAEGAAIVRNHLHRAGTGSGGQLSREKPALLVIGGVGLGRVNCEALGRGANDVLARVPTRWPHLFGVLCVATGVIVGDATPHGRYANALLTFCPVPNPGYTKDAPISWPVSGPAVT